ncbi:glycosyltransferase family 9 protein [Roseateles koreensis]|uniref:Glycosyltransferase family 9 protein n=1 Tax=Roseateles koreensis TaxID=2987526 RepID=A0ABT5KZ07_9BURK|nr:glycosyltransferase family 9 protein [Roseateles koreensis]MDC8786952.1 glycosyltransferase family 9 protein [Roseateles koreensis]
MSTNRPAPTSPQSPRHILIVRLSALGDVALSSGLIPALHSLWPNARISWLVEAPAAPLLQHNPHLHEVILMPRQNWLSLWRGGQKRQALREVWQFRKALRARAFDCVIDPQGLLKSGLMAWFTAAPRRVNLKPREGSQWLMHESVQPQDTETRPLIAHEYRDLAVYLGAAATSYRMDLAVGAQARVQAQQRLAQVGIKCEQGQRYAVLAAFTTRPQKHWIEGHWAELAEGLSRQGFTPLLLGGPGDVEAAARICQSQPLIHNLTGQLRLDETVAAIADSHLLIGVDTGLTHMGIALGKPTVALFGSTAPYLRGPDDTTQVLYDALPCSPCHRHPTCNGRFDCMQQLTVGRVLSAATQVLQTQVQAHTGGAVHTPVDHGGASARPETI